MKRIALVLIAVLIVSVFSGCDKYGGLDPNIDTVLKTENGEYYYESNKIKVISQNIRHANDPAPNTRDERLPRIKKVLDSYNADIIGMQEVRNWWTLNLIKYELIDTYEDYTVNRGDGEGLSILWRKDKFELMDCYHFWLSDTPDEQSIWEGSNYYRIVSWVKLKENKTGTEFYVFNAHFDTNADVRLRSSKLLIEKMKEICGDTPSFVVGDFNMSDDSDEYNEMLTYFKDTAALFDDYSGTFHKYGTRTGDDLVRLDYCFVTDKTVVQSYKVMTDTVESKYLSDHYGIFIEMVLK